MPVVLSIGQCGYDDSRIGQVVRTVLGATLDRAASPQEALQKIAAKKYDLILVNRVFDAGTGMGVNFIAEYKKNNPDAPPIMLVSDYADAQAAAIANGAVPGFGKASIASSQVGETLRAAVKSATPAG
jgi:two-component system, chemotaxis family, chemotaxis protein CheY